MVWVSSSFTKSSTLQLCPYGWTVWAAALTSECPLGSPRAPMTFLRHQQHSPTVCIAYIYQFTANPAWFLVEINQPPWLLALIPHLQKTKTCGKPQWVKAQLESMKFKKVNIQTGLLHPWLLKSLPALSHVFACTPVIGMKHRNETISFCNGFLWNCYLPMSILHHSPPYVLMCSIPAVGAGRCQWHPKPQLSSAVGTHPSAVCIQGTDPGFMMSLDWSPPAWTVAVSQGDQTMMVTVHGAQTMYV